MTNVTITTEDNNIEVSATMANSTTTTISSAEEIREQIEVLVGHENRFYRCSDYLWSAASETKQDLLTPSLNVVMECANLVTDGVLVKQPLKPTTITNTTTASSICKSPSGGSLTDFLHKDVMSTVPTSCTTSSSSSSSSSSPITAAATKQSPNSPRGVMEIMIDTSTSWFYPTIPNTYLDKVRSWRLQMFHWACSVMEQFDLNLNVIMVSFDLLDRFAALENDFDDMHRDDYQLFYMVALYITCKMLETTSRKIPIETLLDMSKGYYSMDDVTCTELDMLYTLHWHVTPPTTLEYLQLYLQLFNAQEDLQQTCYELAHVTVADCFFVDKPKSIVGLVVLLVAARRLQLSQCHMENFVQALGCDLEQLIVQDADLESCFLYLESL